MWITIISGTLGKKSLRAMDFSFHAIKVKGIGT